MSKEQELAKDIIRVAGCVAIPLEERVEMIKASAKVLLQELIDTGYTCRSPDNLQSNCS